MEGENGDDPAIWHAVEDIAVMAHKLDANHPTMTVTAEIGGQRVPSIAKYCPDIDIHGINSYGGIFSVAKRYRELGGTKPFIITEFGPAGAMGRRSAELLVKRAPIELTSTAKADVYRTAWASEDGDPGRAAGSCASAPIASCGANARKRRRQRGSGCSSRMDRDWKAAWT